MTNADASLFKTLAKTNAEAQCHKFTLQMAKTQETLDKLWLVDTEKQRKHYTMSIIIDLARLQIELSIMKYIFDRENLFSMWYKKLCSQLKKMVGEN